MRWELGRGAPACTRGIAPTIEEFDACAAGEVRSVGRSSAQALRQARATKRSARTAWRGLAPTQRAVGGGRCSTRSIVVGAIGPSACSPRCGAPPSLVDEAHRRSLDVRAAHQPRDTVSPDPVAGAAKRPPHPPRAVGLVVDLMQAADRDDELVVLDGAPRALAGLAMGTSSDVPPRAPLSEDESSQTRLRGTQYASTSESETV
jgi:hypothetical protein